MSWLKMIPGPAYVGVSVVIPVRDEVENVTPLAAEITAALAEVGSWECIWVDDGSTDGTGDALARQEGADPRHRLLRMACATGQSAALAAGLGAARGEVCVTMDGDGQMDPADIPRLLDLLHEKKADLVHGVRLKRRDNPVRRLSAWIANGFRNWVTGDRVRDTGCSLRAFRRTCVDGLLVFRGMHRFLPTLIRMNGFGRVLEIPVNHRPRRHGTSKYGIRDRLWVGIADTLAVRWLASRAVEARVLDDKETGE